MDAYRGVIVAYAVDHVPSPNVKNKRLLAKMADYEAMQARLAYLDKIEDDLAHTKA